MRRIMERDRGTITKIADHLTGGGYSARRAAPASKPTLIDPHTKASRRPSPEEARPYVRVSLNGRVVLVDLDTSRQLAFLGEVRAREGREVFVLATAAHGFRDPLDEETAARLAELDGTTLARRGGARVLADAIAARLGLE